MDGNRRASIIDEELLPGLMLLPQHHFELTPPLSVEFAEPSAILSYSSFGKEGGGQCRATRHLDPRGNGRPDRVRLEQILRDLCKVKVEEDSVRFAEDTVHADEVRENQELGDRVVPLFDDV